MTLIPTYHHANDTRYLSVSTYIFLDVYVALNCCSVNRPLKIIYGQISGVLG